jgi:RHS repeat-associated protein
VSAYLTDRLGSVRDLESFATTALVDHLDYDGFGSITLESAAAAGDRYKYTGRGYDYGSGLQYNRARYFDPRTGRWTCEDSLGFASVS